MRDVGSAVAYDGESALQLVKDDEPDVMILDLKMPGIDGVEVLRRVKATNPHVEVIILTGHGSDGDCETCMALGAFVQGVSVSGRAFSGGAFDWLNAFSVMTGFALVALPLIVALMIYNHYDNPLAAR